MLKGDLSSLNQFYFEGTVTTEESEVETEGFSREK